MDIDYHYHATYAAARYAGFAAHDALLIANSAQMIDENGRHVLKDDSVGVTTGLLGMSDDFELRSDPKGSNIHTFRVQMTFQGLGDIGTSSDDTISSIWPVFHFLPGNFTPENITTQNPRTAQFLEATRRNGPASFVSPRWETRRYGGNSSDPEVLAKFQWLCRPHSPMAIGLVNNCVSLCHDTESQVYKRGIMPYLVGVSMHVFIDTWAHQDFVGPASKAINCREGNPSIGYLGRRSRQTLPTLESNAASHGANGSDFTLSRSEWKECAPAIGIRENSNIYVGHGQVGHWPDHSALIWQYQPSWSASPILRNNPVQYFDAFVHMVFAMICIRRNFQYQPFNVTELNLRNLCDLSASCHEEGGHGVPLTTDALAAIFLHISQERDPWGREVPREIEDKIKDRWDRDIYSFGKRWQDLTQGTLQMGTTGVPVNWLPGKSDWVMAALGAFKRNKSLSEREARPGDWLSVDQFQTLDFFKFNIAAKFHYRFVKQQLLAFGQKLLGSWADGAAYADDFERLDMTETHRVTAAWYLKVYNALGKIQRETKVRELSEGMTILMAELEGISDAGEAVAVLRRAHDNALSRDPENYNYGLVNKDGQISDSQGMDTLINLIKTMETTNGFKDSPITPKLPTFDEWESKSSVFFAFRNSDGDLVRIDNSLKETLRLHSIAGLSQRAQVKVLAGNVIGNCRIWLAKPVRETKRDAGVHWLKQTLETWIQYA